MIWEAGEKGSRAPRAGCAALVAAALLAGCGGSTKTVIVQGPPSQPSTASTSTGTSSTSATAATGTSASTSAGEAPTHVVRLESFQSPTGNIGCMVLDGAARCDIVHRTWRLPARPASCPPVVDFGQGLEFEGGGSGHFVCAGDTARDPRSAKLPYGTASRVGDITCVSRATGMTCTNATSGHGFMLSVQQYRLF
ncbi:MAG TPA: DUF6636 domain-containing protein [Solirubrobacteraceae bacterium]